MQVSDSHGATLPVRVLKSLIYLYLIVGLAFGVIRFGWAAVIAAMAEPEEGAFMAGVARAAIDGGIRVVAWAPSLVTDVIIGGADVFDWMLYG